MTRLFLGLIAIVVVLYGVLVALAPKELPPAPAAATTTPQVAVVSDTVVATHLSIPWDLAFLPDGSLLVTERTGSVVHIPLSGTTTRTQISGATGGEGGLLGITLHPDFANNAFVYLYMGQEAGGGTVNRVVRYTYRNDVLTENKVILDGIPGALYHDGGRLEFGPDGKLYVTTGDATRGALAQDMKSPAGKILRVNDDGTVPSDNPYGNAIFSYGHRNPQGLAWDANGNLWETEHGPTGEGGRCCHDELNLLTQGGNYGWPSIIGDETQDGMIAAARHSGDDTWAPASLVYFDGALYFGGLKGASIYKATITGTTVTDIKAFKTDTYGRIRSIRVGPDRMFYITTSNTDGRGRPLPDDDRIIKIDPKSLQ